MPFSALSPEGPVSLLGADAATVENLRSRNRREACFTAKCCGAPLVIRTAAGKAPHFVHKAVPRGCDGDRRETGEHRRLKELIAKSAERTFGWSAETEAVHRHAQTGEVTWRADVLSSKGRARVAFEVQLSHADYDLMLSRQRRYSESGVRGLWFVRTGRRFPVTKELPIFVLEGEPGEDRVRLAVSGDLPFICGVTPEAESMQLTAFIHSVLDGKLKWAPFEAAPDTSLQVCVDYAPGGQCPGCRRLVAEPLGVRARIAGMDTYPQFHFARVPGFRRSSRWYEPIVRAVFGVVEPMIFKTSQDTCSRCSASLQNIFGCPGAEIDTLSAALQLKDLPRPSFGTVEHSWLRRWAVLDDEVHRAHVTWDAATPASATAAGDGRGDGSR